ncbi:hypothetical protein [Tistrella mobilis]
MMQIDTATARIEVHMTDRPVWLRPELAVVEIDHATQVSSGGSYDGAGLS